MKANDHVKTAIRWRLPPIDDHKDIIIEKIAENIIGIDNGCTFSYDHLFVDAHQSELFDVLVRPLIDVVIRGFNATLCAIGQSGSGKTFTMGFEQSVNAEYNGIATRILNSLCEDENNADYKISISFIEIYNEQAFDLLGEKSTNLIYHKSHTVSKATRAPVKNSAEMLALLALGTKKRRIRETKMNNVSSRSHAILKIYLGVKQEGNNIMESVINLVDLAGTESAKKTGNTGLEAHAEMSNINRSLLAFKQIITSMAKNDQIIARGTVLVKMLQDSLNKHSYLTLLGCVNPYKENRGETCNTLKFVSDAKAIKMTPEQNIVVDEFKKAKTPKKVDSRPSYRTPNSSFKRPMSSYSKLLSRQSSEPPKKKIIRPSTITSTTVKKPFGYDNSFYKSLNVKNKPKAATKLFESKPMNDTTFMSMNWANASTSSVIEHEQKLPKTNLFQPKPLPIGDRLRSILKEAQVSTPDRENFARQILRTGAQPVVLANKITSLSPPPSPTPLMTEPTTIENKPPGESSDTPVTPQDVSQMNIDSEFSQSNACMAVLDIQMEIAQKNCAISMASDAEKFAETEEIIGENMEKPHSPKECFEKEPIQLDVIDEISTVDSTKNETSEKVIEIPVKSKSIECVQQNDSEAIKLNATDEFSAFNSTKSSAHLTEVPSMSMEFVQKNNTEVQPDVIAEISTVDSTKNETSEKVLEVLIEFKSTECVQQNDSEAIQLYATDEFSTFNSTKCSVYPAMSTSMEFLQKNDSKQVQPDVIDQIAAAQTSAFVFEIPAESDSFERVEQNDSEAIQLNATDDLSAFNSTKCSDNLIENSLNASLANENVFNTEKDETFYEIDKNSKINKKDVKIITPIILRRNKKRTVLDETVYQTIKRSRRSNVNYEQNLPNYDSAENSFVEASKREQATATPRVTREKAKMPKLLMSPRVILNRIDNLREYQDYLKRMSWVNNNNKQGRSKRAQVTPKPRKKRASSSKAKKQPKVSKIDMNRQHVLNVINTGTRKDLKTLHTIGVKTADLIYNHRKIHGRFKSIEEINKILSPKKYQQFLCKNFLI